MLPQVKLRAGAFVAKSLENPIHKLKGHRQEGYAHKADSHLKLYIYCSYIKFT